MGVTPELARCSIRFGIGRFNEPSEIEADEMIVATGFRPDLSFLREIRLSLDPWLGLTVLLAEQNLKFTLGLSDYGYIIDNGRIRCEGPVAELMNNEDVRRICGI